MIAVGQAVIEAQARGVKPSRYRLRYRRRYWDIEAQAFALEGQYTEVARSQIKSISASRESLDRRGVNRFDVSTITIVLDNQGNRWSPLNALSVFGATQAARCGYRRELMEFSVDIFYEGADLAESDPIPIFLGRATDWRDRPVDNTVSITVDGSAVMLRRTNAELVCEPVMNEQVVETPDGVITEFHTQQTGVGLPEMRVRLAGYPQRLGADVEISETDDPEKPALLTFKIAPPALADIRVDYIRWYQDKAAEWLAGRLCDVAGIPEAERDIVPVTYPNEVLWKKTWTEKADWDTGSFTDVESETSPGDLKILSLLMFDDFDDNSFSDGQPRTWTPLYGDPGWYCSDGKLWHDSLWMNTIYTPSAQAYGTWEWRATLGTLSGVAAFMPISLDPTGGPGYHLTIEYKLTGFVRFYRQDSPGGAQIFLASGGGAADTAWHTIRLTRDLDGTWRCYLDGSASPIFTVVDNTHTTSTYISAWCQSLYTPGFDTIRVSLCPRAYWPSGVYETAPYDTGAGNPLGWGLLERAESCPAGTSITYRTATSADGLTWDAWKAISPVGLILSAVKRYIKVEATFTANAAQSQTPVLLQLVVNYKTSTATIRMANFHGLDVYEALTLLAQISNYEWGMTRQGRLFFRPRAALASPAMTIEVRSCEELTQITDGGEKVFNEIRADYGSHEVTISANNRGDPRPNSQDIHHTRQLSIGSRQLLLDPDADIATGIAIGYLDEYKTPRRGFEFCVDMRPQLELADVITLRILDAQPARPWHVGDTSVSIGRQDIQLYGDRQQSAFEVAGRAVAVRNDIERMRTELELEEVLTDG